MIVNDDLLAKRSDGNVEQIRRHANYSSSHCHQPYAHDFLSDLTRMTDFSGFYNFDEEEGNWKLLIKCADQISWNDCKGTIMSVNVKSVASASQDTRPHKPLTDNSVLL